MAIDFSKYDKMVDLEGLQADVKEAMENGENLKTPPTVPMRYKLKS